MTRLHIGVDMDGVVYDFITEFRNHVHVVTGRPLEELPEPTTWQFYADDWRISEREFREIYMDSIVNGRMFLKGDPLPGAVEQINRLAAAGHAVHFVTDRPTAEIPGVAEQRTRLWLTEHGFEYESLTVTPDKTSVPTDMFIEDKPENYLALTRHGVDAWLLDYPYNRHVDTRPGRRVQDLSEFVDAALTR